VSTLACQHRDFPWNVGRVSAVQLINRFSFHFLYMLAVAHTYNKKREYRIKLKTRKKYYIMFFAFIAE
jgi:hypothetical protein